MSVEQTTQLIQLILNSVLLTVACALVMGGVSNRRMAAEKFLKTANRRYSTLLEVSGSASSLALTGTTDNRLLQAKKLLRRSQSRYALTRYSLLAIYYALLFSGVSTLCMSLRAVLHADWLIMIALTLFVVSVAVLLLSVGLTLIDLHSSDRPLWDEIKGVVGVGNGDLQPKVPLKTRPLKHNHRFVPQTAKPSIKARVG